MFLIENYKRNGFAITTLKEKETDTFIEIVPSCGAILHSFNVVINKAFINVIDSYESQQDFTENLTAKGFKSSKLSPFACRMKNATYNFNSKNFIVDKFSLGAHAIHGLLFDASFSSTNQHANQESAMLEIEHQYKGLNKGFPFHFDCIITYELRKNNEVNYIDFLPADIFYIFKSSAKL